MMLHMFWIVLSVFAVIGLLECILGALELFALRRNHSVKKAVFQISLAGEERNIEYLLNTLSLMAGRMDVGRTEAVLEIRDAGLTSETRREVEEYCKKNPWVLFTDDSECDKIIK